MILAFSAASLPGKLVIVAVAGLGGIVAFGTLFAYGKACAVVVTADHLVIRSPFRVHMLGWRDVQAIEVVPDARWPFPLNMAEVVVRVYDAQGQSYVLPRMTAAFRRVRWDRVHQLRRQWQSNRGPDWVPLASTAAAIERESRNPIAATTFALVAAGVTGLVFLVVVVGILVVAVLLFSASPPDSVFGVVSALLTSTQLWSAPAYAAVFVTTLIIVALFRRFRSRHALAGPTDHRRS
ncbi:PH domain-containing protein [Fodinicola acaciae]|uniref:PH domain-containing protein n=1 Tax=Fodinicola acaciae TaxID=2681555 RepID=UPI0013D51D55|nr:PH domain-containing protein [Fodinicola acaciae]